MDKLKTIIHLIFVVLCVSGSTGYIAKPGPEVIATKGKFVNLTYLLLDVGHVGQNE